MALEDRFHQHSGHLVTVGEMIEYLKQFDSDEHILALWKTPFTRKDYGSWARGWKYSKAEWAEFCSVANKEIDLHFYNSVRLNAAAKISGKAKKDQGKSLSLREWWASRD